MWSPAEAQEWLEGANKRICISFSNTTFSLWRDIQEELGLINDDTLAIYLLGLHNELNTEPIRSRSNCMQQSPFMFSFSPIPVMRPFTCSTPEANQINVCLPKCLVTASLGLLPYYISDIPERSFATSFLTHLVAFHGHANCRVRE